MFNPEVYIDESSLWTISNDFLRNKKKFSFLASIYDFYQKNCYQLGVYIVVVGAGEVGYYITRL